MSKRELKDVMQERMGTTPTGPRRALRMMFCWLTPPFGHVYDAIFVIRPDLEYSYYEHCVVCGKARSWVAFFSNYGKSGAVSYDPYARLPQESSGSDA